MARLSALACVVAGIAGTRFNFSKWISVLSDTRFLLNSHGQTSIAIILKWSHSQAKNLSIHFLNLTANTLKILLFDTELLINFAGTLFNIFYVDKAVPTLLSQSYF